MAEAKRGCGYRKIGGLYLVGGGPLVQCDFLPYELTVCRHCGAGVKQGRGFSWLTRAFFGRIGCKETCRPTGAFAFCPMDELPDERFGLLWVGAQSYPTPADFAAEAAAQGISKRIAQIPKGLVLGQTWVFLAHPRCEFITPKKDTAAGEGYVADVRFAPGIFYMFRPAAIEKILTRELATDEELKRCADRGITPVIVEDLKRHHSGKEEIESYPLL